MRTQINKHMLARLITAALLLIGGMKPANAQGLAFTEERPLVYTDAWDLWPYAFLTSEGEPTGYNVELVKLLCKEMDIPVRIKLMSTPDALNALKNGRADLMMGMAASFHDSYANYGKTVVQLFTHSVVYPKNKPLKIRRIEDLKKYRVIVHRGSFSHHLMEERGWGRNAVAYDNMQEAVFAANSQQDLPIVWNTMSLKWLINTLNVEDLSMAPVYIPAGEYRFMSNNDQLLNAIDSVYNVLQARNVIEPLQNKWFYPERVETGIPEWVWYIAGAFTALLLAFFAYYLLLQMKERKMTRIIRKANSRLSAILQMSNIQMFIIDLNADTITAIDGDELPLRPYTIDDFCHYLVNEDAVRLKEQIHLVGSGEKESVTFDIKAYTISDKEIRNYAATLSVLRRDKDGKPTHIIGTRSDMTDIQRRQLRTRDTKLRYQAIFNTPTVDMVYFNAKGLVEDINQKVCDTFNSTAEEMKASKVPIYDIIGMSRQWFETFDYFHATIKIPDMIYEIQLVPVHDENGSRIGFYGTGLNVDYIVDAYHEQQRSVKKLEEANRKTENYIANMDYVLRAGGVRIATYSPDEHLTRIFNKTNEVEFVLTQSRCLRFCDKEYKNTAARLFDNLDQRSSKTLEADIKTIVTRKDGRPLFLQFHFLPIPGNDGKVESYFGICRDISEIKATEQQLAAETMKMQDIESIKNAFLRNMSYEIRTPLTSVIGFAEMFEMEHTPEEEAVFVEQIKDNSRNLLNLVTNILLLSRLDAKMIDINPKPIDFAQTFEDTCQTAWADYQQPGVDYIVENPYSHFVADIDEVNLGIIIKQVVANAAQHTTNGLVRTRYDYNGNALSISVEDTGEGISQESLEHIFERFTSNTPNSAGLGLSICHQLVEMMGGNISIKSEKDRGTIVWIVIPCQVSKIERK